MTVVVTTTIPTSYTLAQLVALEAALASGATTVSYEGKSVTYRSVAELREAIYVVRAALFGTGTRRRLLTRTEGDKGL